MAAHGSAIIEQQIDKALSMVDYGSELVFELSIKDDTVGNDGCVIYVDGQFQVIKAPGFNYIHVKAVSREALSLHINKICAPFAIRPLETVILYCYAMRRSEVGPFVEALSRNSYLCSLSLKSISFNKDEHTSSAHSIWHPLFNHSCTLSSLKISCWPSFPDMAGLASALATNATLKTLEIYSPWIVTADVLGVLKALETNTTLTSCWLDGFHEDDEMVCEAAIDLLSVNFTLKNLVLKETETDNSPKIENLKATIDSMLRENASEALAVLNDFPRVQPTSARVFFCGNGFAGKTTLQKTMVNILDTSIISKVRANLLGNSVGKGKHLNRTAGIEVTSVNYGDIDISFWDLAGQKEYHGFHDLMFPNEHGPSLFLIICNLCSQERAMRSTSWPMKPLVDMGAELRYWLRYISSNTRKSPNRMPHISFIFTHSDMLGLDETIDVFIDRIQDLRKELEQEFESLVKVVGTTFFVDGRKTNAVQGIIEHTIKEVKEIMRNSQSVYDACNNAKKWIAHWMKDHPNEPWMKRNDLIKLCSREFYKPKRHNISKSLSRKEAATIAEAVLFDLHRTGNLIHFKDEDIVLVDIQWFCKDFMGSILEKTFQISMDSSLADNKLGVWRRKDIKNILERTCNTKAMHRRSKSKYGSEKGSSITAIQLDWEQLINIMIQLEFCFEVNPGQDIFIPATLCRSHWQAHRAWTAEKEKSPSEFGFIGRRLECKDEKNTFLTPGFFPRLQVHLRKVFESMVYYLEKDLIKIVDDRMEVLIEFNEAPTSFIDIMAKFLKPKLLDHVLDFIGQRVIQNIRDLQRRSGRWQGIDLVELALRPACVKKLTPPRRKQAEQSVSLDRLSNIVHNHDLVDGFENSTCITWCSLEAESLGEEYTPIIELIGERCFTSILSDRLAKVEELSAQLGLSKCIASSSESDDISSAIAAGFEQRPEPSQLDRMEANQARMEATLAGVAKDMKVVKGAINRLLDGVIPEVQRLLTELCNHNPALGQGDSSELPRFFLLNKDKSLVYRLVPGLRSLRLNFLCENEPMPHLPVGQEGIEVTILDEGALKIILPYLHFLLSTLALIFKVGAPMFQTNGIMVPDCRDLLDILLQKSRGVYERSYLFPEEECSAYGGGKHVGYDPVALEKARIWVQRFMSEKKCDNRTHIFKRLGLMRKELMHGGCAWLCEDHYPHAM